MQFCKVDELCWDDQFSIIPLEMSFMRDDNGISAYHRFHYFCLYRPSFVEDNYNEDEQKKK